MSLSHFLSFSFSPCPFSPSSERMATCPCTTLELDHIAVLLVIPIFFPSCLWRASLAFLLSGAFFVFFQLLGAANE